MRSLWITAPCLIILHTPDAAELRIDTDHIFALRPAAAHIEGHVAKGTNTILYMSGKTFGVRESASDIVSLMEHCDRSQR